MWYLLEKLSVAGQQFFPVDKDHVHLCILHPARLWHGLMENLQDRNKDREKVKDSHTLSSMWSADTLTHLILMINDCFATACDCTRSIYCVLYIFIHELFSRTCVHYLQHYLQVFHVSFLSLYQLMDVTLSLLLLGAQWVQAVQICTPCRRRGRTQEEGLYDLYRSTSAARVDKTKPLLEPQQHFSTAFTASCWTKKTRCCCWLSQVHYWSFQKGGRRPQRERSRGMERETWKTIV